LLLTIRKYRPDRMLPWHQSAAEIRR